MVDVTVVHFIVSVGMSMVAFFLFGLVIYLIAATISRRVALGGSFQYSIAICGAFTFSARYFKRLVFYVIVWVNSIPLHLFPLNNLYNSL